MKFIIHTSTMALMIFINFACTDNIEPPAVNAVCLSVTAPAFHSGLPTRTTMTGSTAAFTSGDVVGVFETLTNRNNVSFSWNGSSWNTASPMYWYNGSSTHTFYAYYPYNSTSQELSASLPVLNQQKVTTVPDAACDMLVTPTPTQKARSSGTSVSLTMSHALALLRFDIKMSVLSLLNPYVLDSLIVRGGNPSGGNNPYGIVNQINTPASINYSFSTGTIQIPANNSTTCAQFFKAAPATAVNLLSTSVSVYVLILPGAYTNPTPAVQLVLHTLGILPKKTGYLTLPNASNFMAGRMYTYQVSIGLNLYRSPGTAIQKAGDNMLIPAGIRQEIFPHD